MPTGDLKNNLRKLRAELKCIHYKEEVEWEKINVGLSEPLLPILHYALADCSYELGQYLQNKGYDFYGKSDFRFLEILYKILIQEFCLKPMLTKEQFFSVGFAEIRVIFVVKILSLLKIKSKELQAKGKKKKRKPKQTFDLRKVSVQDYEVNKFNAFTNTLNDINEEVAIYNHNTENEDCVIVPQPDPDISAFTPVINPQPKSNHKISFNEKVDVLDITELEDEDEECLSIIDPFGDPFSFGRNVEVVEENKIEAILPDFKVTKHTGNMEAKLVTTQDVNILKSIESKFRDHESLNNNNKETSNRDTKTAGSLAESLVESPVENSVSLVDKSKETCENCKMKEGNLISLTSRLETLEKQMFDVLSVNAELSARVVILETKLNMIENKHEHQRPKGRSRNTAEGFVDSNEEVDFDIQPEPNKATTVNHNDKSDDYSPIKYTDDDIIIKDFKPITMRHVFEAYNADKENNKNLQNQTNDVTNATHKFEVHKNKNKENDINLKNHNAIHLYAHDLHTDNVNDKSDPNRHKLNDPVIPGIQWNNQTVQSPNISGIIDENTKSTVRNVRRFLKETELLLKNQNI